MRKLTFILGLVLSVLTACGSSDPEAPKPKPDTPKEEPKGEEELPAGTRRKGRPAPGVQHAGGSCQAEGISERPERK